MFKLLGRPLAKCRGLEEYPKTMAMSRPVFSSSTLDLGVDRKDREPIQAQITRQIRDLVLSGRLKPQERMPSSRVLADDLGVARATIVEAYDQLSGEGYLETRGGSATRVAAELPEDLLHVAVKHSKASRQTSRAKRVPARAFRSGLVDWEHFPHDEWGRLLGRYWRNPPVALLEHNDVFGWLPFRAAIAAHLFEWRGIQCEPEQVVVSAGGMDAFDLIHRAVLKQDDQVWLEEPGYPTARRVFSLGGSRVVDVPIDGEGLIVSEGRSRAPHARLAFVTPARQYPTGVTMPLSRRLELLDWANEERAVIVEDDYDSEYRYVGRPLPALMSLDRQSRVIYSGTFSKVFSPIVRLGFLVVPRDMIAAFTEERQNHGAPPSLMVQPALAQFMESGAFAVHIRRMRRIYAQRREVLISALAAGDGRLFELDASPSGLMLLLRLLNCPDDRAVATMLREKGIETAPLSTHFSSPKKEHGLLLSFAGFNESELKVGAAALLAALS
jgi:GntR family transcriptional regulator / MocR family aminotransferase